MRRIMLAAPLLALAVMAAAPPAHESPPLEKHATAAPAMLDSASAPRVEVIAFSPYIMHTCAFPIVLRISGGGVVVDSVAAIAMLPCPPERGAAFDSSNSSAYRNPGRTPGVIRQRAHPIERSAFLVDSVSIVATRERPRLSGGGRGFL